MSASCVSCMTCVSSMTTVLVALYTPSVRLELVSDWKVAFVEVDHWRMLAFRNEHPDEEWASLSGKAGSVNRNIRYP